MNDIPVSFWVTDFGTLPVPKSVSKVFAGVRLRKNGRTDLRYKAGKRAAKFEVDYNRVAAKAALDAYLAGSDMDFTLPEADAVFGGQDKPTVQ